MLYGVKAVRITSYQTGGQSEGDDTFDFQPQLTTKPTASEDGTTKVYSKTLTFTVTVSAPGADGTLTNDLAIDPNNPNASDDGQPDKLVGVSGRDWTLDSQPELTSEPTAPEGGGTDGKGYVLTSIRHSATDASLVDQTNTEASSRLFVGNLTMNSEDSIPATAHVAISLGDGKAIEAAGDDYGIGEWSDPAQPDGGTNMSPWTVTHSSNSGNRANPDTFDCSELTQWASSTGASDATGDAADFVAWQKVGALGDPITFTYTVTNTSSAYEGTHALCQDVVIPAVQTDDGLLLPAVQDDGLLLPAVQTDDAFVFTAISLAESGGNSEPHAPHGEDSLGLFQINIEPNQYDPDAFANDLYDPTGPAVATETLTIVHDGFLV